MSKASKSLARAKRAANKRAAKAANQKRWSEFAGTETNRKKRQNSRRLSYGLTKHTHPNGACGNIGCLKCSTVAKTAKVRLVMKTGGMFHAQRAADRLGVILAR